MTEDRIRKALEKVAVFAADDPAFLPVFQRLEADLAAMQSTCSAHARAKALAVQSAVGASKFAA